MARLGGLARMAKLNASERSKLATKAVKSRWAKKKVLVIKDIKDEASARI